jgi:hypothetical protein
MDESGNTQNRRSRRSHLLMAATLEISGRAVKVKLRNLSSEGAQVEGDDLPVEGTEIMFRKGDMAVAGTIIWTKGKQAGIRFAQLLETQAVLNHIAAPRPRVEQDFRRPGLASRALSEAERKLAASWIAVGPVPNAGD